MPVQTVPRLRLNMIVKNEAERIARCLLSVKPYVSSYVIVDTGSTDGTEDVIRETMKGVPGVVLSSTFVDFATTRNEALRLARMERNALPPFDYFFLVDADMELVVEDDNWLRDLGNSPTRSANIEQRAGIRYFNTRLLMRNTEARYVGVTHEYLKVTKPPCDLRGLYFIDHADGSNRVGKAQRDIDLLTLELHNTGGLRSLFYLAQTLRDAGQFEKAAWLYRARAELGGFAEEAWHAKLSEARCYRALRRCDAFLAAAMQAVAMRPQRMEPLADLTRHWRETGAHELVMRNAMAMHAPVPDDILFVEPDAYGPFGSIAEDVAISGFYVEGCEKRGFDAAERQATTLACPVERRANARANLRFYAPSLLDLLREMEMTAYITQLRPPLEEGWHACNPSVAVYQNTLVVVCRAVNYTQKDQVYSMPEDGAIRTRNYYTAIDEPNRGGGFEPVEWFEIDEMQWLATLGAEGLPRYPMVRGMEDMRLFANGDDLMFIACIRELEPWGLCQQYVGRIGGTLAPIVSTLYRVSDEPALRHEKNWTPVIHKGSPSFIYNFDGAAPRFLDGRLDLLAHTRSNTLALDHLRGGSQAVELNGGYLCVTHEVIDTKQGRHYLHRFVWMDGDLKPCRISLPWTIEQHKVEFVAGLALHPQDPDQLVMSYGIEDRAAYLMLLPVTAVRRMVGL